MFNLELLFDSLKVQPNIDLNIVGNGAGDIKTIGILSLDNTAIKSQYNWDYIFANDKAIISTCNDNWIAANSFARSMRASFGKDFILFPTLKPIVK
jgi:hypothetical protein